MKKISYLKSLTLICVLFIVNRCTIKEDNDRNTIVFIDSIETVEKTIFRQNELMKKLPMDKVSNYFFIDSTHLYINNKIVDKVDDFNLDTTDSLSKLTKEEKVEFTKNALFLQRNKITGSNYDALFKTWRYAYAKIDDQSFRMYRDIIYYDSSTPLEDIKQAHVILDTKKNLLLLKGFTK